MLYNLNAAGISGISMERLHCQNIVDIAELDRFFSARNVSFEFWFCVVLNCPLYSLTCSQQYTTLICLLKREAISRKAETFLTIFIYNFALLLTNILLFLRSSGVKACVMTCHSTCRFFFPQIHISLFKKKLLFS